MANNLPEGLTLVSRETQDSPESVEVAEETQIKQPSNIPEGLTAISRPDKLAGEMTHEKFVSSITDNMVEDLPQTIGGIGGGIVGAVTGGPWGGIAGSGLGGAFGKSVQSIYRSLTDSEKKPESSLEAFNEIAWAGGKEAAYDMGGRMVGSVIGRGYHILRPKEIAGISELQSVMKRHGGSFTKAQRTDEWLAQQTDALVRGSLTGKGTMRAADNINDAALKKWENELSDVIATSAKKNMTNEEFSMLLENTMTNGRGAFRTYVGDLYGSFDDLVKTTVKQELVTKKIPTAIENKAGSKLTYEITDKLMSEFRPVDVRGLKKSAAQLNNQLKESANLGKSDFGGDTINKVMNLDDALKFSTAQNTRSTLLEMSRAAKASNERKLAGSINKFATDLTTAMDDAAKKQGGDAFKKYLRIKNEAETGYKAFNSNFMYQLTKDDKGTSAIADKLFKTGDISAYTQYRRALNESAKYDPRIDVSMVNNQVKQKYLERIFSESTKELSLIPGETVGQIKLRSGVPSAASFAKFFQDPKKAESMAAMFPVKERQKLLDFANALAVTQKDSDAGLGMLMTLSQGGIAIRAASGKPEAFRQAMGFFIPIGVASKMMTNPTAVNLMTAAAKTPHYLKQSPAIVTKLYAHYEKAKAETEGQKGIMDEMKDYLQSVSD